MHKCISLGREGNVKDIVDSLKQYQFQNISSDELVILIVGELLSPQTFFSF